MSTRTYNASSWMVRRWDKFNGNKPVPPKSFCQFWRTVLLWATLASIPVVGKAFLEHLKPKWTEEQRQAEIDSFDRTLAKAGKVLSLFVMAPWFALWPVRKLLYFGWRGICTVAEFVDSKPRLMRLLATGSNAVFIVITVAGIAVLVTLMGYALYQAWRDIGAFVGLIAAGIIVGIPVAAVLIHTLGKVGLDIFDIIWEAAVDGKHRVCPFMDINRSN